MKIDTETMNDNFTKFHLRGLPVDAVIHRFISAADEYAHDHPFKFTSFIISGGYVERVFTVDANGGWSSELITRLPGTSHVVEAHHIHQIVELLAGECWTIILPEKKVKEPQFWRFGDIIETRFWDEAEFRRFEVQG